MSRAGERASLMRWGVDVGGTSIELVVVDDDGEMVVRRRLPTPRGDVHALVRAVTRIIHDGVEQDGAGPDVLGCGIPGVVDPVAGTVANAVNLAVSGRVPFAPLLAEAVQCPVVIDNDVRAAALAALEWLRRSDPTHDDVVLLNIGTGVSAGIVVDGRALRGPLGTAGEIGHAPILGDDIACACGATGCVEARVAGPALATRWPHGDAADLLHAAASGDPHAAELAGAVADDLAHVVHWLAVTTGIGSIVLGGGVGTAHPSLAGLVRDRLAATTYASAVAADLLAPERVTSLPPDLPTGALGAAALAVPGAFQHHPDHLAVGIPRAGKETR